MENPINRAPGITGKPPIIDNKLLQAFFDVCLTDNGQLVTNENHLMDLREQENHSSFERMSEFLYLVH